MTNTHLAIKESYYNFCADLINILSEKNVASMYSIRYHYNTKINEQIYTPVMSVIRLISTQQKKPTSRR